MKGKTYIIFILIIILPCILIALIGLIHSPKETPTETTETTETNSENDFTVSEIPDTTTTETISVSTEYGMITSINPENLMIEVATYTHYKRPTSLVINEDTEIIIDGVLASLNELTIGDFVTIQYTGGLFDPLSSQLGFPLQITKMETDTITGVITEIHSEYTSFMFAETADAEYWSGTTVYVKDNTIILINDTPASLRNLSVGDSISIEFTGEIAESSPAQLHHPLIIKLIEE